MFRLSSLAWTQRCGDGYCDIESELLPATYVGRSTPHPAPSASPYIATAMGSLGRHLPEILLLLSGGLFTTTLGFAIAWIRARERAVRAEAMLSGARQPMASGPDLSPALDAIAFEVERIGEGQRFLTRVLSNHTQPDALIKRPVGSITPH